MPTKIRYPVNPFPLIPGLIEHGTKSGQESINRIDTGLAHPPPPGFIYPDVRLLALSIIALCV